MGFFFVRKSTPLSHIPLTKTPVNALRASIHDLIGFVMERSAN